MGAGRGRRGSKEQSGGDRWQLPKHLKTAKNDNNRGRKETKAGREIEVERGWEREVKEAWIPNHRHDTL